MVGTVFTKKVERHEMGTAGKSMEQTWKVISHQGDDIYLCVRIDSTDDPMLAANPQKRTFKEKDILSHLKKD